jgi:lipopolysaccharide transport system permease protein
MGGDSVALPRIVVESDKGFFRTAMKDLWQYKELLYFLIWRDVKVRYKQTVIGAAWAILQPLITMIIFTVIFGNFAKIPSDGMPYPIFAYTALVPWSYFSQALSRGATNLVNDSSLITKVYFPRLMMPLAAVVSPTVDFLLALLILVGMMAWYGIIFTWWIFTVPIFMLLAFMTALSVSLWLSPLNIRYRDVGYTLPFLSQIWMYASPVVYPVSLVPERWRLLYGLNPMAGVIEGFRWALLGKARPDFAVMAVSWMVVLVLLASGVIFFKKMERTFADVI